MKLNQKTETIIIGVIILMIVVAVWMVMRNDSASQRVRELEMAETALPSRQLAEANVVRINVDRVEGPSGLQSGAKCTAAQAAAVYGLSTITQGGKFCSDFNDAILTKTAPVEVIATEGTFLHKANGERCYQQSGTSAMYLTNPSNLFFMNYLTWKLPEVAEPVILDGLRPNWGNVLSACGGAPQEYKDVAAYHDAIAGLADSIFAANIKIGGVVGDIGIHWYRFQYLDPMICEPCFSDWDTASITDMLYDVTEIDGWEKRGKTVYVVQEPDRGCVRVTWFNGLNLRETASMDNPGKLGFLYRGTEFHPLAIVANNEGVFAQYSDPGWVAMKLNSNGRTYAIQVECE